MRSLAVVALLLPTPILGQRADFVPTMERGAPAVCPDRPARPAWMDETGPREAYRATTLMRLYALRRLEGVVAEGRCDCEVRYPAWDAAEAEYDREIRDLDHITHARLRSAWRREARALAEAVRALCKPS